LRGWISGPAIPTFIVDGIAGLGKMPVTPKYYELNKEGELIFTNYEGKSVNMRHLNRHED
jgi:lysine 2,3-aminomutase